MKLTFWQWPSAAELGESPRMVIRAISTCRTLATLLRKSYLCKMCFNKRSSQVFVNECWWSCVWERNCSRNLGNFTRVLSHKSHLLWIMRLFYFSIARSRLEKRLLFLLVRSKTCARYFHFILASLSVSRTIFFILHSFAHFITEFIYYTIFYSTILLCSVVAAFLLLLCHEHELLTLSQYDYTTFFHLWTFLIIDHITFSCSFAAY